MLGTGLSLAAALVDGVTAFVAAVCRGARSVAEPRFVSPQCGFGKVVIQSQISYIHVVSVLLQIEQGIELGEVVTGPASVVLGIGQDVCLSDTAFQ